MSNQLHKWNKWWIGWIVGLILPVFGFMFFALTDKTSNSLHDYITLSYRMGIISKILSLSLIPNFLGFYFFLNKEWYSAVRGIILGMMTWGILILYLRFTIPQL